MSEISAKKRKPWWAVLCIVLAAVIVFLGLVVLVARAYFRHPVGEYYRNSEKEFKIPYISEGLVAQGFDYDEKSNSFFITGYMSDGTSSPICIVEKDTGKNVKNVRLENPDGTSFTCHAGGIHIYDKYVYIAGYDECLVYVFSYDDIINAKDEDIVKSIGMIEPYNKDNPEHMNSAFVGEFNGKFVVGEFFIEEDYETPLSHRIETTAGDKNNAVMVAYDYDENGEFGLSAEPVFAVSITDRIQGMYQANGRIYLSTSYGLTKSHIYIYDESKIYEQGAINMYGKGLPLYVLDSASLVEDIVLAPMAEEIVVLDGRIYIMCESASNKYIFGKFTSANWCYSTDLSKYK